MGALACGAEEFDLGRTRHFRAPIKARPHYLVGKIPTSAMMKVTHSRGCRISNGWLPPARWSMVGAMVWFLLAEKNGVPPPCPPA